MTYQVLARKWRPQDFSALIGQQPIVTALTNALGEGRIAQAYLFSGIRGVGKTTAARLLAKALNCEQGPTPRPCNQCTACREITAGGDLDVLEVDAATYSKVEQVRELTESLRYGPARDRYKVLVLDEIHRLSRQAFDALLKIVEEPPPHLVFVFATTEAEAVPATILSRCQEFHFRRVPAEALAAHLRSICEAEGITASDKALRLIARAGEGSVRDAVALLDQLATFGGGSLEDQDAARLLGGLDTALLHDLLGALVAGDPTVVAGLARRLEEEGWDPRHVYSQFLGYCRDALHLALAGDGAAARERVELPAEETAALGELASAAGYENLLRLVHHLLASEIGIRRSENGYIAAEIAWLRAAELPKLVRVEELLGGGGGRGAGGATAADGGAAGAGVEERPGTGVEPVRSAKASLTRPLPPQPQGEVPRPLAPPETEEPAQSSGDAPREGRTGNHKSPEPAGEALAAGPTPPEGASLGSSAPQTPPAAQAAPSPREGAGDAAEREGRTGNHTPPEPAGEALAAGPTPPEDASLGSSAPQTPPARPMLPSPGEGADLAAEGERRPGATPPPDREPGPPPLVIAPPEGNLDATPAASTPPAAAPASDPPATVAALLAELRRLKQPLAARLETTAALEAGAGRLVIRHVAGDADLVARLARATNRQVLDEAVRRTWGPGVTWETRADLPPAADDRAEPETAPEIRDHPTVQTLLELFGGRIESVEEREEA